MVSPEVAPLAKTGGLADVTSALSQALKGLGVDVRLVLPFYRSVREGGYKPRRILQGLRISLGDQVLEGDVLEGSLEGGIPVYLIDREDLYDRSNLYGNSRGDYYDNLERFTFLSHAALKTTEAIAFWPHILHCHDWQTGLIPALLRGPLGDVPFYRTLRTVFTIHNLGYQGIFPSGKLKVTSLPPEDFFHPEGLEFWGNISLLKAGIVYADAITTVSPTYAREIQTEEMGMGMEGILRSRRKALHGILNGIDYRVWDPETDRFLSFRYSAHNLNGKQRQKFDLLQELGLLLSLKDRPLLGMVSRLDRQKGFDLVLEALAEIMKLDVGMVVLGSGDHEIQEALWRAAHRYPGRMAVRVGMDERLAHRIIAGSDILLLPSRYEPCGLTQMYALRYGTVPVVRATGGLDDTVVAFDEASGKGNGFKFTPYEPTALTETVRKSVEIFHDRKVWRRLQVNGMKADFSWERSATRYLQLYQFLLKTWEGIPT
jgi:starch synthase